MATPIFNNMKMEQAKSKDMAKNAQIKAHKQEQEKVKQGWRYIKVNDRLKVFVPCDRNGKPTKDGLRLIQKQKELYGIK